MEIITTRLLRLTAIGCYWQKEEYDDIWIEMINIINYEGRHNSSYYDIWKDLSRYSLMLLIYTILISCIKSKNYRLFRKILMIKNDKNELIINGLEPGEILRKTTANQSFDTNMIFPMDERIYKFLKEIFNDVIKAEHMYTLYFDKAQYFYSLCFWELNIYQHGWVPLGCFYYRYRNTFVNLLKEDIFDESSPMLLAGFFNNDYNKFIELQKEHLAFIANLKM